MAVLVISGLPVAPATQLVSASAGVVIAVLFTFTCLTVPIRAGTNLLQTATGMVLAG